MTHQMIRDCRLKFVLNFKVIADFELVNYPEQHNVVVRVPLR